MEGHGKGMGRARNGRAWKGHGKGKEWKGKGRTRNGRARE